MSPTGRLFTLHWYIGVVPPFVGVAVKVTLVPAQTILSKSFEAMLTLTGRFGFTVVVMALLVAGLPVAQVAVEVIATVTV